MVAASEDYLSKNQLRVTERIRKFLWLFPHSSPKEVCRMLFGDDRKAYLKYRNMVSVEKCNLNRWRRTKIKGRLPKPLLSAHRVEWELEKPLDMVTLSVLAAKATKRRPKLSDPRPVDEWYVVPNRNNMREFHNEFVTVRVFPKSGTVRILAAMDMDFEIFRRHVKIAFLKGGLDDTTADRKSRLLIPTERHRTFRVGPVTPFKIDFYKEPLGLTLKADGSHPDHIESVEGWPSWIRPQLLAIYEQTDAVRELTKQLKVHLSVMRGIDEAAQDLRVSADLLRKRLEAEEKPKPFKLEDWLRDVGRRTRRLTGK